MNTVINANDFGFLPQNDGETNAAALQTAIDKGGEIVVTLAGDYFLSEPIYIGDNTSLSFAKGITLIRQPSKTGVNGNVLINKGAFDGVTNRNIKITGLHLLCNGVESTGSGIKSKKVGLRAQVAFLHVENLEIYDFSCVGLLKKDYGLQISAFNEIRLEGLYIEGNKDGVHLGMGKNFVVRHGKFKTYDDPIALNAFDYSVSNTHVGWIENGLIEDCYDLADDTTTGYFCRILGGAWVRWSKGMLVHHSDTVVYQNRVYRVVMNPTDSKLYKSETPPSHASGVQAYDGINWVCTQEGELYDCGCRNILLKDIRLQKKRSIAVAIDLNYDTYARSFTKGSKPVPQGNITFDNVCIEADIQTFFRANYPVENITIKNSDIKEAKILFEGFDLDGLSYPPVQLTVESTPLSKNAVISDGRHKVTVMQK
ncbi:MAG: hypothetical protein IJY21_01210 [Clostridia bacterium]|nr:hypothetical protein [Clostridia bacterium]